MHLIVCVSGKEDVMPSVAMELLYCIRHFFLDELTAKKDHLSGPVAPSPQRASLRYMCLWANKKSKMA